MHVRAESFAQSHTKLKVSHWVKMNVRNTLGVSNWVKMHLHTTLSSYIDRIFNVDTKLSILLTGHTFSAFWVWSSVVSARISVTTDRYISVTTDTLLGFFTLLQFSYGGKMFAFMRRLTVRCLLCAHKSRTTGPSGRHLKFPPQLRQVTEILKCNPY